MNETTFKTLDTTIYSGIKIMYFTGKIMIIVRSLKFWITCLGKSMVSSL